MPKRIVEDEVRAAMRALRHFLSSVYCEGKPVLQPALLLRSPESGAPPPAMRMLWDVVRDQRFDREILQQDVYFEGPLLPQEGGGRHLAIPYDLAGGV
ncbi:hypothetical protein [Rhizobium herbae]|uniref:Uncharacterized protein n=1 Tax=Rhizobium herbae TaxID=508661 RepID=A0ABS4EFZ3_9HYPH|nr:hypothetical protein [Rhizobium herbae]MBP1856865.1 hypothetical protein [Rhizobium herbae]